ncbi:MAG: hypothetical protein ACFFAH_04440 [Promethearchaeota archaeon]
MQNIQAKKESLMRLLGMVVILFGLLITFVIDYIFVISNITINLLILCIIIPWFVLIILLKLEMDFFVENTLIFYIIIAIYSVIIIVISIIIIPNVFGPIQIAILAISDILLIFCWHNALSIYKKEKIVFLLGGIGYFIISLIFRISSIIISLSLFFKIVPIALVIFGIFLIIFAEMRMKKKGLLNYI